MSDVFLRPTAATNWRWLVNRLAGPRRRVRWRVTRTHRHRSQVDEPAGRTLGRPTEPVPPRENCVRWASLRGLRRGNGKKRIKTQRVRGDEREKKRPRLIESASVELFLLRIKRYNLRGLLGFAGANEFSSNEKIKFWAAFAFGYFWFWDPTSVLLDFAQVFSVTTRLR